MFHAAPICRVDVVRKGKKVGPLWVIMAETEPAENAEWQ